MLQTTNSVSDILTTIVKLVKLEKLKMTSNEDLMKFLLGMEEKRERDREADKVEMKQIREKERKEDKEEILNAVDKCLGEKVDEAIGPLREKTLAVEKVQLELGGQVNMIIEELRVLKEKLSNADTSSSSSNRMSMAAVVSNSSVGERHDVWQHGGQVRVQAGAQDRDQDLELQQAISLARRTVGLHRIDAIDLARQRQEKYGGAKNEEEEKYLAVLEFLKLETKIDRSTLGRMEIERIFAPAREDPQCLYVTFKQMTSVTKIFEKTRCMRKESRILFYVPKQFYSRFRGLSEHEYNIRKEEKCQTRIKMGLRDLMLFKRARGERWEHVPLPKQLPPVELGTTVSTADSGSPAPGRPGQNNSRDKRGRDSTGSSTDENTPKQQRKESPLEKSLENNRDEAWRDAVKEAHLVSDEATISPGKEGEGLKKPLDLGIITSVTGTPS